MARVDLRTYILKDASPGNIKIAKEDLDRESKFLAIRTMRSANHKRQIKSRDQGTFGIRHAHKSTARSLLSRGASVLAILLAISRENSCSFSVSRPHGLNNENHSLFLLDRLI